MLGAEQYCCRATGANRGGLAVNHMTPLTVLAHKLTLIANYFECL